MRQEAGQTSGQGRVAENAVSKSLSDVGCNHPKAGDVVGARTVIRVAEKSILFGKREGELQNCGAYVTDYREWFDYERRVVDGLEA